MFEAVGGNVVIDKIVNDFYRIMATDPKARECFATHAGKEPEISADKLSRFLSGWLGGPQLYLEKYGHPRLRMKHIGFSIGPKEGEQWLYCMKKSLDENKIPGELQQQLMPAFENVVKMLIS